MSFSLCCPRSDCGRSFNLGTDQPGSQVRCLFCGHVFEAEGRDALLDSTKSLPRTVPAVLTGDPDVPEKPTELPMTGDIAPASVPSGEPTSRLDDSRDEGTVDGTQPGPAADECPANLGRFAIRQRLGEGAFGVVYRAYDPQTEREVAIKVAKPAALSTPQRVERFLREGKAAAQLRHPNIVPLLETGRDGDRFFLVYAFIEGKTLEQALQETRSAAAGKEPKAVQIVYGQPRGLEPKAAAQIVRQLAEALAYAHGKNIVHRDVKPANVMLDEQGTPLLMDFGLAAYEAGSERETVNGTAPAADSERLTQEGAVLGTPAYMAPEIAGGQIGKAPATADQYSLGIVLYELLTGQTPFNGAPEAVLIKQVKEPPVAPRSLKKKLPRDLEAVCLKCLAKDPKKRYRDCKLLADDLRRWDDGFPIAARRLSLRERAWRWARRQPGLAVATAAAFVLLIVATVTGIRQWQLSSLYQQEAELREQQYQVSLYSKQFDRALLFWAAGDLVAAQDTLTAQSPSQQSWEWDYLTQACQRRCRQLTLAGSPAWRSDGQLVDLAQTKITVLDLNSGRPLVVIPPDQAWNIEEVVKSPVPNRQGTWVLTWHKDDVVRQWDLFTGQLLHQVKAPNRDPEAYLGFALSADGKEVASLGIGGKIQVWDLKSGAIVHEYPRQKEERSLIFSLTGKLHVAYESMLANAATGRPVTQWNRNESELHAISPDGSAVVVIGKGQMSVTSLDSVIAPNSVQLPDKSFRQPSLSWSAEFLAYRTDHGIKVVDVRTGQEVLSFSQRTPRWEHELYFSPDARHLVDRPDYGGPVEVWSLAPVQETHVWKEPAEVQSLQASEVTCLAVSPDSRRIASGKYDTVKVRDAATGQVTHTLTGPGYVTGVAFSKDGKHFLSYGRNLKIWNTESGLETRSSRSYTEQFLAASPQLDRVLEIDEYPAVRETGTQTVRRLCKHSKGMDQERYDACAAFSLDGQLIAIGGRYERHFHNEAREVVREYYDYIDLWDPSSEEPVRVIRPVHSKTKAITFSTDGKRVITGHLHGIIHIWDTATGKLVETLNGHASQVNCVQCSQDGKWIISCSSDHTIRLWDAASGAPSGILEGHTKDIVCLSASSDSRLLISLARLPNSRFPRTQPELFEKNWDTNYDERGCEIMVWDLVTKKLLQKITGQNWVSWLQLSPDGRRILVAGKTQTYENQLQLWDRETYKPILTRANAQESDAVQIVFSPDSQRLARWNKSLLVQEWDLREDWETGRWKPDEPIIGIDYLEDGRLIAVTRTKDEAINHEKKTVNVTIWDVTCNKRIATWQEYKWDTYNMVSCGAVSADGRLLLVGNQDGTVRVWDTVKNQQILTLEKHSNRVKFIALSPDGQRIATSSSGPAPPSYGSEDNNITKPGEIKIWDSASGKELISIATHSIVTGLRFSSDSRRIIASGVPPAEIRRQAQFRPRNTSQNAWAYLPQLLGHGESHGVKVWDAITGQEILSLMPGGWAGCMAMDSLGKYLVAADGADQTVKVWDTMPAEQLRTIRGHSEPVRSVRVSPDGQRVVSCASAADGSRSQAKVWEFATGKVLFELRAEGASFGEVHYSPDGRFIATVDSGNEKGRCLRIWDATNGKLAKVLSKGTIGCAIFSPDGRRVASSRSDGTVTFWDIDSWNESASIGEPYPNAWDSWRLPISMNGDGSLLAMFSGFGGIRVLDVQSGMKVYEHSGGHVVQSGTFDVLSRSIVYNDNNVKSIRFWNWLDKKCEFVCKGNIVCRESTGNYWAVADERGCLSVFKTLANGHRPVVGSNHGEVLALDFTPDGKYLVSGGADRLIKIWDMSRIKEKLAKQP